MGNLCPIFGFKHQTEKHNKPDSNVFNQNKLTQRPINNITQPNEEKTFRPDNSLKDGPLNIANCRFDKLAKNLNSTIESSDMEKRNSSLLFQGTIFETSSIIFKGSTLGKGEDCYTLIENMLWIRKTQDSIRVISPHSESQLNCPLSCISSIYYLSEGIPLDSIKQICPARIIHVSQSPILTRLKIECKRCQQIKKQKARVIKMTFSSSLINVKNIQCDTCHIKGQWRIISINSNFPVWGNGYKLNNDQPVEVVPEFIRVMGCISCLRYTQSKVLQCGCFICKTCSQDNQVRECKLCESNL